MITCVCNAQVINFKTTAYAEKKGNYSWSDWKGSDMYLTMDLNNDRVIIYSPTTQVYQIYSANNPYYDSDGDCHADFKFIDQDGDYGTLTLLQRRSGSSEIYIRFRNVQWCYRVRRL